VLYGCEIGTAWTLVTGPTVPPISVDEAKDQARISDTASDLLIANYIEAAREAAELYMGRGLLTQTWKLTLDAFANVIPLPMAAPLQSITSVKYYDENGVLQTLATSVYDTDLVSRPGRVTLKVDQTWPTLQTLKRNGLVEITYVVGWTSADLIPERIKQGIRQYVTYLDQDRDGMDVRALDAQQAAERCWSDRIGWAAPQWGD
jgi:uncharacterized phiE125 gp8 family phage protein